ncbi:hypothetical protein LU276_06790 [Moraxella haemolytica]|uniref:hypothetical protein n=1 Tax=Moraxella haemolytica TaxID=2904119 RepID=UPI002543D5CF|nr:hypothetical protein [Moraxella sp. ZY171148]WII94730.1 hypothetical protein LU276_06790 [Moraxella sp. ZY171148]
MPMNKSANLKPKISKNPLPVSLTLGRRVFSMAESVFVLAMLGLSWHHLLWWQYAILFIMSLLVVARRLLSYRVLSLDCTYIDELWDIGVKNNGQMTIWHGYLSEIKEVFGGQKGVFLRFYVIMPNKRFINVVIYEKDIDETNFRRLLGLCHSIGKTSQGFYG